MNEITSARRRKRLLKDNIEGYCFIGPWLIGFFLFTFGPMLYSIFLSFTSWDILTPPRWVGVANFRAVIHDSVFWKALYNTFYYALFSVPSGLVVALLLAVLLNQKVKGQGLFRTFFYLPSVVSGVATSFLWLWIFNPDYGMANQVLQFLHLPTLGWLTSMRWSKPSLIIMSLWACGGSMLIFLAGLQNIPRELYEAAQIDGAKRFQTFKAITIPLLSPSIFFNLIIGLITSLQIFTPAYIMTKGGPVNETLFYVLYLYRSAFEWFKMGYASALAWILFVIILVLSLIQMKSSSHWVHYQ